MIKRPGMVGWYDPQVLARSAALVGIANLFGQHSDTRLIEALASQPQKEFGFEAGAGDFWFDYVSDIADGWNPTFAIATAVAADELDLATASGEATRTRGGELLIFGGDEVYPYPSKEAYAKRAEAPYAAAFAGAARHPQLFAIPGNHDWYDSLVAFSRVFCRPERGFAGCKTHQTRSYFALRLPHNWWLFGIDLQLGADLDEPQVRYFQDAISRMPPDAHAILCVPDPQWIYEQSYPRHESYQDTVLKFFEEQVLRRKVAVFLTGDLHHYRRHQNADGVQKIVSGGGGAFLHPTHTPQTQTLRDGFEERACYPDRQTSAALTWRNLLFPILNPRYMWIPATLYAISAWLASASLDANEVVTLPGALQAAVNGAIRDPLNGLWLLMFIAAFVVFTDTHVRWYRIFGGVSHALSHLLAAFALGWLAILLTTRWLALEFGSIAQMLLSGLITFVGGGAVGALVLGAYLFLSLRIFGRHATEAFSSLRIQDYKQWLRLRIDAAGALSLFAIGIDRVPRKWSEQNQAMDPRATRPRLIEQLTMTPLGAGRYRVSGIDQQGQRHGSQ